MGKKYKNLNRWYDEISNREAVKKGYDLLKKGGSIEIITDSSIYQRHLEELISDQSYFKKIKDFPITCQISTFHKKAIEKGHTVKKYVLKKTS